LSRLHEADSGEAKLDGKAITRPGSDRGVVFQQYSLFRAVGSQERRVRPQDGRRRPKQRNTTARALLDLAGLLSFENIMPDQLSAA